MYAISSLDSLFFCISQIFQCNLIDSGGSQGIEWAPTVTLKNIDLLNKLDGETMDCQAKTNHLEICMIHEIGID